MKENFVILSLLSPELKTFSPMFPGKLIRLTNRKHCSIFQKTYPRNQICLNGHFVVNVGIHRKYPRSIFRPSQLVKIKIFKSKCLKANHTISENSVYFLRCESFVTATTLFPSQTKHFSTFKHFWVNLYSKLNNKHECTFSLNISTYLIL